MKRYFLSAVVFYSLISGSAFAQAGAAAAVGNATKAEMVNENLKDSNVQKEVVDSPGIAAAKETKATEVHIKRRYIYGGGAVIIIIAVAAIMRRKKANSNTTNT